MKKDYSTKKKTAIAVLSIVAICLAGGLFYYINTMGIQQAELPAESTPPAQTKVVVPEINTGTTAKDMQSNDGEVSVTVSPLEKIEEQSEAKSETSAASTADETHSQKNKKPSDGKPKTPDEATPPSESPTKSETSAPTEQADRSVQGSTEKTSQPKTKQDSGTSSPNSVYVPGFGNIEPSGTVEGSTSYTDGDWDKQIGEMK
ncbi:DUF6550 family protein [Lacrimispora sp.]|uniref:DUF6550 family protein n=1 Tax=Lacrimispora sp. TaxID=2719234 RepID=UPI00289EC4B0|nr:DUF6550 family protein [Lacrimispora sp.]